MATFKDGGKVTVYRPPAPATDRPAAGVVQPGFKPGPDNLYHGTAPGPAAQPKGGGPGVAPAPPISAYNPQETV